MAFSNIAKFIIGLFLIGCTVADTPPPQFIKNTTFTLHIDKEFNNLERDNIRDAIRTWERVSSGSVKFVVWWNQTRPGLLKNEFYKKQSLLFIWYVDRNDKTQLSDELIKEFQIYRGLYSPNGHILIFDNLREPNAIFAEDVFRSTVMHEIGHMLGLEHSENRNSLMYPMVGSWCITKEDADILCKIYSCIPKPECDVESEAYLLR